MGITRTPPTENRPSNLTSAEQSQSIADQTAPFATPTRSPARSTDDSLSSLNLRTLRLGETLREIRDKTRPLTMARAEEVTPLHEDDRQNTTAHDEDGPAFTAEDEERMLRDLRESYLKVQTFTTDIDKLEANGQNIARWTMQTERAVRDATGFPNYWAVKEIVKSFPIDLKIDQIALRIIFITLCEELKDSINNCVWAHDALKIITEQFKQGGRTSEVVTFKELISVSFDHTTQNLTEFANDVERILSELEGTGFKWNRDGFKGMILQIGALNAGDATLNKETNALLNARYRTDKSPFTSVEVKAAMQNVLKERDSETSLSPVVRTMVATALNRTRPSRQLPPQQSRPSPPSQRQSRPRPSLPGRHTTSSSLPPRVVSRSDAARVGSESHPIPIPRNVLPEVHEGQPECFHCGMFGHWKGECPRATLPRSAMAFNDFRLTTNGKLYSLKALWPNMGAAAQAAAAKPGNVAGVAPSTSDSHIAASAATFSAESTSPPSGREYLLNLGATHNVSPHLSDLFDFRWLPEPIPLQTAAYGNAASLTGIGKMKLPTVDGDLAVIEDVYYCPRGTETLISLGALKERGARPWFWGDHILIRLTSKHTLLARYKQRRWWLGEMQSSYPLPCFPDVAGTAMSARPLKGADLALLWHKRFGHVAPRRIRQLIHHKAVEGLPDDIPLDSFTCEDCLVHKSTRARSLARTICEPSILEVVVSDVAGPFPEAWQGGRLVVTFRDVWSTFSEAVLIKQKSEVPQHFMNVIATWERTTSKKIKTIRTDRGGEYTSKVFNNWLKEKGIVHEYSNPCEPEQNGVAEGLNRTIQDMVRPTLASSGLPQFFWGLAYLQCVYLHNRLPNSITRNKMPYELFHGVKPQLDILRSFGAVAFPYVPKERRVGKLAERANKCFLVSYISGGKGWVFYDPVSRSLIKSGMARFPYEDVPSLAAQPENPPSQSTPPPQMIQDRLPTQRQSGEPPNKNAIDYLIHSLKLGDFSAEERLASQEAASFEALSSAMAGSVMEERRLYSEAMRSPHALAWREACAAELGMMSEMEVWEVVPKPSGAKPLGLEWVFKYKAFDDTGEPTSFKARLVAKGYHQKEGIDYTETFAPTATFPSLQMLLTIAARAKYPVHSFDVTAAYLHSHLDEKLYFNLPPGFMSKERSKGTVLSAKKALYGTKQGARCWWKHLEGVLKRLGFSPCVYDQSLYVLRSGDDVCALWLHVDDVAVMGSSEALLLEIREAMMPELRLKWSESLDCIVGVNVKRLANGSFESSQPALTRKILAGFVDNGRTVKTPMNPQATLVSRDVNEPSVDPTKYLSAIGSVNYLEVATRPDVTYAVNFLARFSADPGETHWKAIEHLAQYLQTTGVAKLKIDPIVGDVKTALHTYVDANWGGEFSRSVHGFVTMLLGCPISWTSKRQSSVATSTCHAEYMALGTACRESIWLRNLVSDIIGTMGPAKLHCDNTSAIHVATNNSSNKRTRHTDREFFYVNKQLFKGHVSLHWINTREQKADMFTKALGPTLVDLGRRNLALRI